MITITPETRKRWRHKIDLLEEAKKRKLVNLNDWEHNFLLHITCKLDENEDLSLREAQALLRMAAKIQ